MQARIKFKREAARMKAQAEAMGIEAEVTIKLTKICYTFMAWDSRKIFKVCCSNISVTSPGGMLEANAYI